MRNEERGRGGLKVGPMTSCLRDMRKVVASGKTIGARQWETDIKKSKKEQNNTET
jgi:hypothetical protein